MAKEEDFDIDGVIGTYFVKADGSEATARVDGVSWVLRNDGHINPTPSDSKIHAALVVLSKRIWSGQKP